MTNRIKLNLAGLLALASLAALQATPAAAQTPSRAYGAAGGAVATIAAPAKGKTATTYEFCTRFACPLTTWAISGKKLTDGFGDSGVIKRAHREYTVTLQDGPGSPETCTFDWVKTKTGLSSELAPGSYVCQDGFEEQFWAERT